MDETEVKEIFATVFGLSTADVTPDMSPDTVEAWDSFGHMQLITAIEEKLGVTLSMDQVVAIDSYSALSRIVREAGGGK